MSINQKVLKEITNKFDIEIIIRQYDNFIQQYQKKHYNELLNTLNKEEWYKTRDNIMERFVKRYYLRGKNND